MRKTWHRLTLLFYFALLALMLLWPTLIAPPKMLPVSLMLLIGATPLLLVLFGVLHARPRALSWTAFISLLYFIHGTVDAWAETGTPQMLALAEAMISIALFLSSTYAARDAALMVDTDSAQ